MDHLVVCLVFSLMPSLSLHPSNAPTHYLTITVYCTLAIPLYLICIAPVGCCELIILQCVISCTLSRPVNRSNHPQTELSIRYALVFFYLSISDSKICTFKLQMLINIHCLTSGVDSFCILIIFLYDDVMQMKKVIFYYMCVRYFHTNISYSAWMFCLCIT